MKYGCLIILFASLSANVLGQFFSGSNSNAQTLTGPASVLKTEIPLASPSVVGSTYLDDTWQYAEIVLANGYTIEGLSARVEIEQAYIEIQFNGEIKYLDLKNVNFITFSNEPNGLKSVVKKASQFIFNDAPLKGVVLVRGNPGQYAVIKQFYIEFLQSNYNVAMDVGAKDHRKVKRERFYISQGSKLILVKGTSKKIAGQLGADKEKALDIIKKHRLNLSRETDLLTFASLMAS